MTTQGLGEPEFYHVGGSLPLNSPAYVRRQADDELYNGLKLGKFCYVFNSRQMGKSSLRVHTMQRLRSEGFACVAVDLTQIGSKNTTPDQWYAGIALNLAKGLFITDKLDLRSWLKTRDHLSPVQRLSEFIEEVLLKQIVQQIVIFVDEIDSVLSLEFPLDDFFALIRECYNQRADKSSYERITFALLGVVTPSELIQDKKRTPFNIGKAIELSGFKSSEIEPLVAGLASRFENPQAMLKRVLYWTSGQPFLTQKICKLVAASNFSDSTDVKLKWIDKVVGSEIIKNWEAQDNPEHLKTIQDRLLSNRNQVKNLLGLYKRILDTNKLLADDSFDQEELCLSGLVVREKGYLVIQNRVYKRVFNKKWAEKELEKLSFHDRLQVDWFTSSPRDNAKLLSGKDLDHAISRSVGMTNKSFQDWEYLIESLRNELRAYRSDLIKQKKTSMELEKNLNLSKKAREISEHSLNEEKQALIRLLFSLLPHLSRIKSFTISLAFLSLLFAIQYLFKSRITIWELVIFTFVLLVLLATSLILSARVVELSDKCEKEEPLSLGKEVTLDSTDNPNTPT